MERLVLSPQETAEALGCSIDVVRDLKRAGRLPYVKLGRTLWGVPDSALRRWLDDEADASLVHLELEAAGADIPGVSGRRHEGAA
jgi:excisionase family DNA binding protein